MITLHLTNKPQRQKTYLQTCAPSEDTDQPAHTRSLIRIFTGHSLDNQGCKVSSRGQRRLWSDCANAQADLSLRLTDMTEGTFSHRLRIKWLNNACRVKVILRWYTRHSEMVQGISISSDIIIFFPSVANRSLAIHLLSHLLCELQLQYEVLYLFIFVVYKL